MTYLVLIWKTMLVLTNWPEGSIQNDFINLQLISLITTSVIVTSNLRPLNLNHTFVGNTFGNSNFVYSINFGYCDLLLCTVCDRYLEIQYAYCDWVGNNSSIKLLSFLILCFQMARFAWFVCTHVQIWTT